MKPPKDDQTDDAVVTPAKPTPDVLALEAKVAELTDSFLRARADLENFRKRTEREKDEFALYAGMSLLAALLPLVDGLDRAAEHLPVDLADHDWAKGILHIRTNLDATFRRLGVEKFGAIGDAYDAELHEAMARGAGPANEITAVFEPGYLYRDKVLRPARVQVGGAEPDIRHTASDIPAT